MALQIMPRLLSRALSMTQERKLAHILVATSGDTGKAALEGFCDVPGVKITVFYPCDGVSPMQKRQMITQKGDNVFVSAVRGNFDDAQTGVKKIFANPDYARRAEEEGFFFSSANSINWGRLAPQIVYYVSAARPANVRYARTESLTPSSPLPSPRRSITIAVNVQITTVSANTSNIPKIP